MMKKTSMPVEGLYILSFFILMTLAGSTLYLYINAQSTASDYRINAAGLLEQAESLRNYIDQERRYILETVVFFLGSQSGIPNIDEFSNINLSLMSQNPDSEACYDELLSRLEIVTGEMMTRCAKSDMFEYPDQCGVWKCDNYMYSYAECSDIDPFIARVCCKQAVKGNNPLINYQDAINAGGTATGYVCHEGCLITFNDTLPNKCTNRDSCGALWCKENNLEVPETFSGIPYYYKMGEPLVTKNGYPITYEEGEGGKYCISGLVYNPEYPYNQSSICRNLFDESKKTDLINNLVELSNKYFGMLSPNFKQKVESSYDTDLDVSFAMHYLGCNKEYCEFSWMPIGNNEAGFVGKGSQGRPLVEFSTEFLSHYYMPIPLEEMVETVNQIVDDKLVVDFMMSKLRDITLNRRSDYERKQAEGPENWYNIIAKELGVNCTGVPQKNAGKTLLENKGLEAWYYDNSSCGQDPWNNDCNYECLMQFMSSELYFSIRNPLNASMINLPGKDKYLLRPNYRFIYNSLGGVFYPENNIGLDSVSSGGVYLKPGYKYHVFVKAEKPLNATIKIIDDGFSKAYNYSSRGESYDLLSKIEIGNCVHHNPYHEGADDMPYNDRLVCCMPEDIVEDESGVWCEGGGHENAYCTERHPNYGKSHHMNPCTYSPTSNPVTGADYYGQLDYQAAALKLGGPVIVEVKCKSNDGCNMSRVELLRVEYTNTIKETGSYEYYKNTSDCSDGMGEVELEYYNMDKEELYYTALCMRGLGFSWAYIYENETVFWDSFTQEFSKNDINKINELVYEHPPCVDENNIVRYGGSCTRGHPTHSKIIPEQGLPLDYYSINEYYDKIDLAEGSFNISKNFTSTLNLEYFAGIRERLYELNKNKSYMAYPVKWNFAYRDAFMYDQTDVGGDSKCGIRLDDVDGRRYPDCHCRKCGTYHGCILDFSSLTGQDMVEYLYNTIGIFTNQEYLDNEVVDYS